MLVRYTAFFKYILVAWACLNSMACEEADETPPRTIDAAPPDSSIGAICDASTSAFTSLAGGTFRMHVTRVWLRGEGGVDLQFPSDELPDYAYQPVSDGGDYSVEVSEDESTVKITKAGDSKTMVGRHLGVDEPLNKNGASYLYALSEGTFAGGRFRAWSGASAWQAELTVYGSGLPIVQSEEGDLLASGGCSADR